MVTDTDDGFVQVVQTKSANEADIDKLDKMIPEINAQRIYADKDYCSKNNRKLI